MGHLKTWLRLGTRWQSRIPKKGTRKVNLRSLGAFLKMTIVGPQGAGKSDLVMRKRRRSGAQGLALGSGELRKKGQHGGRRTQRKQKGCTGEICIRNLNSHLNYGKKGEAGRKLRTEQWLKPVGLSRKTMDEIDWDELGKKKILATTM